MGMVIIRKGEDVKDLQTKLAQAQQAIRPLNAGKHYGVLKLRQAPLQFQEEIRAEWDERPD
jgi:hypothetical protein